MTFSIPSTVSQHLAHFSGRTWLLPIIQDWLENGSEQLFLLTGGPGTGKSMIMGWLATAVQDTAAPARQQIGERISAVHFCRANDSSSYTPLAFADNMANQLTQRVVGFDEALVRVLEPHGIKLEINQTIGHVEAGATVTGLEIKHINLAGLTDTDSFDISFVKPLQELYKNGYDQPMLLLVDSLDEAWSGNIRGQELVKALAELEGLPPQVKVLTASRPDPRIVKHFQQTRQFDLVNDAPDDVTDIHDFAHNWLLHRRNLPESKAKWLAGCIDEAAAGIFLYAYMVLSDVMDHRPSPEYTDAFELPDGMRGIYHEFLTRELGEDEDRWYDELKPLLGLIAVAQGSGITRTKLKALLGHDPMRYLRICHQYLSGTLNDGPFRIFHKSLADFLLDDPDNMDYEIDATEMHKRFAKVYQPGMDLNELDEYDLNFLADHLAGAGRLDDLEKLLLDFNYLQAKLDKTDINDLLNDFDYLLPNRQAPARLVQSALRLSISVLATDKTQLAGQLIGRLKQFEQPSLQTLVTQAKQWRGAVWLQPVNASLTPPGGSLQMTLSTHDEQVNAVVISPDGQWLVSGSDDKMVKVWEMATGREVRTLLGHDNSVRAVAISPDGQWLISGSSDKTMKVWELAVGREVKTLWGHDGGVESLAISLDGQWLVSGSFDNTVKVWELATGKEVRTLSGHEEWVNAVAISPDGQWLVSGSDDKTVKVWEMSTGRAVRTLSGHDDWVKAVAISPDGQRIVSASWDNTVKVWEMSTGKEVRTLSGHDDWVKAVTISSDGQWLISGSWDTSVKVWELATGREVRTLSGHDDGVSALALSSDGRWLASGSWDKTVKVWELDTDREVTPLASHHYGYVTSVAISPDGQWLISASLDKTVKVWELATGREVRTLSGHDNKTTSVAISPDGQWLVSGTMDKSVKVWKLSTGREIRTLGRGFFNRKSSHDEQVTSVAISPDGQWIVSGSDDKTVKVWELATGREVKTLFGHDDSVEAVAISPDGQWIVSGSDDKMVKVWELATGSEVRTLSGHEYGVKAVAISPDGQWIISGSWDKTVRIWDLATGREIRTLSNHNAYVETVAISPDGQWIISGSWDKTVKVWELTTGRLIMIYSGESNFLCCYSASSGLIVAGDIKGYVHLLRLMDTNTPL